MALRRDKIQLDVEINGKKAGQTYAELIRDAKNLNRELKNLVPGTDDFVKKTEELKSVNNRLADIRASTKGAAANMNELRIAGVKLPGVFQRIGGALGKIGFLAVISAGVALFRTMKDVATESLELFDIQAKADAQLRATIESTRGAAGRSFEELKKQASELQTQSLFGDEQINQAQAILLTFTNIKDEVFDQTVPSILDLSVALGTDLKSSAIQVGKALNDPIAGVTALSRSGVQFSSDQKEMIKTLVETGQTADAQRIILAELETQFKGSAQAAALAGRGPYQSLSNRVDDLKEKFGELIDKGLKKLQPILAATLTFVEKFVSSVTSGEKATGRFSGAINFLVAYVKILGRTWSFVGEQIGKVGPVFAGLSAAATTAIDNIKLRFESVKASAQLFAKELQLAVTFDDGAEARLRSEIAQLQSIKADAAAGGKSVGEAFSNAYTNALEVATSDQAASEKSFGDFGLNTFTGGDEAAQPAIQKKIEDRVNKQFDSRLKGLQAGFDRENLLLERQRIKEEIDEATFNAQKIELQKTYYEQQLSAFDEFGRSQENKALELQNKLLELQRNQAAGPSGIQGLSLTSLQQGSVQESADGQVSDSVAQAEREAELLKQRFLQSLISEQEYNESRMEIKRAALDEQLEFLRIAGELETEQGRNTRTQLLEIEKQIDQERIANTRRTEEARTAIFKQGLAATGDLLQLGADILNEDVKNRQRHARTIKAFETAKITVNLLSELSAIYKNAQTSTQAAVIGPVASNLIAVAQGAIAITRAGIAIDKVRAQKFFAGGKVPALSGERINNTPNIPTQPGGDNIFALLTRGEVVLNAQQQQLAGGPSFFRRLGVPGFVDGGLVDTTPTLSAGGGLIDNNNISDPALLEEVKELRRAFTAFPRQQRSYVVFEDIENSSDQINTIRGQADI